MYNDTIETPHEHVAESRLSLVATAIKQLNAVRPGERIAHDAERWSVAGAAEYLNEHPESVRAALAVLRLGYCIILDGVGYLDTPTLLAVGRWLHDQDSK